MTTPSTSHGLRESVGRIHPAFGVGVAALCGIAMVAYPFHGDQALFTVFARMMDDGAVLYRDMWDVKQPGIFVFYLIAGKTFGFGEFGAHLLELIVLLATVIIMMKQLRHDLGSRLATTALPLTTLAGYYMAARIAELTQVETVVAPLIVTVVLLLFAGDREAVWRYVVAGIAAGTVALFKSILVLIPIALIVFALSKDRELTVSGTMRRLAATAAGGAVPLVILLAWAADQQILTIVYETFIEYPSHVYDVYSRDPSLLLNSTAKFVARFAPQIMLAAVHLWRGRRSVVDEAMLVWIAAGGLTVAVQLWWSYLFFVMVVPVGYLAAKGVGDLVTIRLPRLVATIIVLSALPIGVLALGKAIDLTHLITAPRDPLLAYRTTVYPEYGRIRDETASVRPDEPVYVMGNPLVNYLSNTDQGARLNGWAPQFWTADLWSQAGHSITRRNPSYIFIESPFFEYLVSERGDVMTQVIERDYSPIRRTTSGTWYARSGGVADRRPAPVLDANVVALPLRR